MEISGLCRWYGRFSWTLMAAVAAIPAALLAQGAPSAPSKLAEGEQLYAQHCAGCHGPDGRGTDRGPALAGNPRVRARSVLQLGSVIRKGIPGSAMPAFALPTPEIDALAALVGSLNPPASESAVPGSPTAGERFFFGSGQCGSCHMVAGRGGIAGPDLSNVGRQHTAEEIRQALVEPSAKITPGYELITVRLKSGATVRGFARNRSNFDVQLQDLDGRLRLLPQAQIAAIEYEKQSLMPPVEATPEQLQDLIAYLSRLTGVKPGMAAAGVVSGAGEFSFSRIRNPKPGDWPTYDGKLSGNRYSELTEINRGNVGQLGVKWTFTIPLWQQFLPDTPYFHENMKYFGLEVTPIVADGIMYVTGPHQAFALDASSGRPIWRYSRLRTPGLVGDASLGTNRGVAILGDKVFLTTDNAHLIALNRMTGQLVWEAVMPDEPQHYGSTVAPLIVKDLVVAGVSGGDWGLRGFIAAYKADTGERAWRFWTIPDKGQPGSETWQGKYPELGGGSTWLTGTYDPDSDTLFWPTATPYPNTDGHDRPGDNLFTECILALNPNTGKLKWHYQFVPHDVHVWDATEPPVLVDAMFHGQPRKLLLLAHRNGFFYVLDRTEGQVLLAKKFVQRVTWASGIGPDGRPQLLPETDVSCPEDATNWNAAAFSPLTRLYYIMAMDKCVAKVSPGSWKRAIPPEDPGKKYLRALDIETGNIAWEIPQTGPTEGKRWAGVLATAGGIVFYGDPNGDVTAVDQRDGKLLWHLPTNATIKTSPMTYTAGERQFVALAVGSSIIAFGLP